MDLRSTKDIFLIISMILIALHATYSYVKMVILIYKLRLSPDWPKLGFFNRLYYVFRSGSINLIFFIEYVIIMLYITIFIAYPNTINTDETDISTRIERISDDLSKASSELLTIQQELEARIQTVEELKAEADIAENMISLSEEQVSAIQAKIHQEINANSGKSLLQNILVSLVFFLLGLFVQPAFRAVKNKFSKTRNDNAD